MTNRRNWAMFLVAAVVAVVAKAQQWREPIIDQNHFVTGKTMPKLNGQCPVCGTMAAPFKHTISDTGHFEDATDNGFSKLMRCVRCNAAFWQDAG